MIKDNLHQPVELVLKEYMDECPRGLHAHTFFELVYIVGGNGTQHINTAELHYKPGNLFLVAPHDSHLFRIRQATQFFFIRFNSVFLQSAKGDSILMERLEHILQHASHAPGCILKDETDRLTVKHLMDSLIREHLQHGLYHQDLIKHYLQTLLVLVARNITQSFPAIINEASEEKIVRILEYIQANIYYPERLRAEAISNEFGVSETYLGRYFKKHTGETLQEYLLGYKLKLIENRLLHSSMRINEIADEFGFTDKSHLNRIFKKYKGVNPGVYRKSGGEVKAEATL